MQRKSKYMQRRRSRKPLDRITKLHPLAAIAAMVVIILVTWRITATDRSRSTHLLYYDDELLNVAIDSCVNQQIVDYPGFKVSFNSTMHQPNYVAWELTADEARATGPRESKFETDPDVYGCPTPADYKHSGVDRGHMIPAADVKWNPEAMKASHLLSNICPQDHRLNAGAWANLENNCRSWAIRDSAIVIICGPVLTDRMPRTIGKANKIPVPERFFKVVLSPYSNPPRGIGFIMNNGQVNGGVQATAVTIDQVEDITGFDFFASLPDEIENEVEAQCAYHVWQRKKR